MRTSLPSRHRSSTSRSNVGVSSQATELLLASINQLSLPDAERGDISSPLKQIEQLLREPSGRDLLQDFFRRAHGFEALLDGLARSAEAEHGDLHTELHISLTLQIIFFILHDHEGNKRYFSKRVRGGGWAALLDLLDRILQPSRFHEPKTAAYCASKTTSHLLAIGLDDTILSESSIVPGRSDGQASGLDNMSLESATIITAEALAVSVSLSCRAAARSAITTETEGESLIALQVIDGLVASSEFNALQLSRTNVGQELLHTLSASQNSPQTREVSGRLLARVWSANCGPLSSFSETVRLATVSDQVRGSLSQAVASGKYAARLQFVLSSGGHAALELPCLSRQFPSPAGYSMEAWIRIERFDEQNHLTIFGAFDQTQTCFVLAYIEANTRQLILQTSVTLPNPSVRFKRFKFEPSVWYHVTVVHKSPKSGLSAEVLLFVDGRFVERKEHCLYPKAPPGRGIRDAPFPPKASAEQSVQAFLGTPLHLAHNAPRSLSQWSLASFHLYDLCLTRDLIAVHYALGPSYSGNFQDRVGQLLTYKASAALNRHNEELHGERAEKSGIVTALQGRGLDVLHEGSGLISISGTTCIMPDGIFADAVVPALPMTVEDNLQSILRTGNSILVNSVRPFLSDALARDSGYGVLTGGASIARGQTPDDAAWQLCGYLPIHVLLIASATTSRSLENALRDMYTTIGNNFRVSEIMEKDSGYGLVALLIRLKLRPSQVRELNLAMFESVVFADSTERDTAAVNLQADALAFIGIDQQSPSKSLINNPLAYRALHVDMDTWRCYSVATQGLYYQQFTWLLDNNENRDFNAKRMLKMRIARKFLDCLRSDSLHPENLPHMLKAFSVIFTFSAAKADLVDFTAFVSFCLQGSTPVAPKTRRSTIRVEMKDNESTRSPSRDAARSLRDDDYRPLESMDKYIIGKALLQACSSMLRSDKEGILLRRMFRSIPVSWVLHLLDEKDIEIVEAAMVLITRGIVVIGAEFLRRLAGKHAGLLLVRKRIAPHWRSHSIWWLCLSALYGIDPAMAPSSEEISMDGLSKLIAHPQAQVHNADMLECIFGMLEMSIQCGRGKDESNKSSPASIVIAFLPRLHRDNNDFRSLATSSSFVKELINLLFRLMMDTPIISARIELANSAGQAHDKDVVVKTRSGSTSSDLRPAMLRTGSSVTLPGPSTTRRLPLPRRPSSFVLVDTENQTEIQLAAHFAPVLAPIKDASVEDRPTDTVTESLLDVLIAILIDQVCLRKDFGGFGLFHKVPAADHAHQVYFESSILLRTMSALWKHLSDREDLLQSPRTLTNLARYCLHMAEAVFEGWLLDGSQALIDFTGHVLDYVQRPDIAMIKDIRLCSQAVTTIRVVFLRVVLLRLSELDESKSDAASLKFLQHLMYWQTILFAPDNQETTFLRLLCYVLYTKLISTSLVVRFAAAGLFRMLLVQKPTEAATILVNNADADQQHLSTGFVKLATHDDDEMLQWVDERRDALDSFFLQSLAPLWQDFVDGENRKTADSARARVLKRQSKLQEWVIIESRAEDTISQADRATSHWRSNCHAKERLRLHRSVQDHQESILHLQTALRRQQRVLSQPCGLFPDDKPPKWQLDQTEAGDRMRVRLLRDDDRGSQLYQPKRKASQRLLAARLMRSPSGQSNDSRLSGRGISSPVKSASRVASGNSMPGEVGDNELTAPEDEFEIVDDPQETEEAFEDKNRKIMRSVQRGDSIKAVFNVSRIIGLEASEGLLIIGRKWLYLRDNVFQRSDGEIVSLVNAPQDERDPYVQMISGREIRSSKSITTLDTSRSWAWKDMLSMSKRRFLFRDVAIEVFFSDGRSYLLIFADTLVRNTVYASISTQAPHIVGPAPSMSQEDQWRISCLRSPEESPQTFGDKFANVFNMSSGAATRRWIRGEISNFHYLMLINTIAGRTFNDLTQYPVFPWVLADYESEELDLRDPRSFRDLSKPMGCQQSSREADFKERYQSFLEMGEQNPFHYGTHYSSAMIVTSYLIRLQPFVQSNLILQGGSFDHADRLFDSIEKAWKASSQHNMTDVRELTPEFFYLPEFLMNINGYDFGVKEGSGQAIGDVQLPRWAHGDPHLFIRKQREALESAYVSEHLHEWIDLIFGYKQKGEAALEATNVFHPLSYQGAKDLDTIHDPVERLATIGIIHNFGQTPHQVFARPHPKREADRYAVHRLDTQAETLTKLPRALAELPEQVGSILSLPQSNKVLTTGACKLYAPFHARFFVQWQYADNSIRFFDSESRKLLGLYEELHIGPIATAHFLDSRTLITGGADCVIGIWDLHHTSDRVDLRLKEYLFGHRTQITHLAPSKIFSTLASASADGQVLLWDLNRFECIRVLRPASTPLSTLAMSDLTGQILVCTRATATLHTLNGHTLLTQRLGDDDASEPVTCAAFYAGSASGAEFVTTQLLFTGHARGTVKVWSLVNLGDGAWHYQLVKYLGHADPSKEGLVRGYVPPGVTAVEVGERAVWVGLENGTVWEWDIVVRSRRR